MTPSVISWLLVTLYLVIKEVNALRCTKEINGHTQQFDCPQPLESPDKIYCCGTDSFRFCCTSDDFNNAINMVGLVIGVMATLVVVVVIIVIISCYCCTCCLLAKRRHYRGRVLSGPSSATTTTTVAFPNQQPAAYPQQPYAPQPYPQQYPPPAAPYPYPPVDNPPPYGVPEQPAYNPEYPMPK